MHRNCGHFPFLSNSLKEIVCLLVLNMKNYFSFQNFLGEKSTELNEQRRKVSQIHIHPQFDSSMLDNDFSLLELESQIEVTDYIGAICLPEDSKEDFGAGTLAVATGWGREASINKSKNFSILTVFIIRECP